MGIKQIYLIRHGETDFNKQGIIQGCGINAPLNEKGRRQAKAFFEKYKEVDFDKIYTSKLLRAQQTVEEFRKKGVPQEEHPGLNEINWGVYEGKKPTPGEKAIYHSLIEMWKNGECDKGASGGESPQEVAHRQREVIDLIFSRPEEKRILICMHGRAMRIFLCQLFRKPLEEMDVFPHRNTGLYILNFNGKPHPELEKENCTLHYDLIPSEIG